MRNDNITMLQNTLDIFTQGYYIKSGKRINLKLLPEQMREIAVYLPKDIQAIRDNEAFSMKNSGSQIQIDCLNMDSYSVARRRAKDRTLSLDPEKKQQVLVLNLANPVHPGGGVRLGARAQEEDLCRKSSLLLALETEEAAEYYNYNKALHTYMGSDALMITPQVEIIRDEDGELLEESVTVAVMTCAAPMLRNGMEGRSEQEYEDMMCQRMHGMLTVAAHLGYQMLVLGAWGCGAFGNDARVVSDLFCRSIKEFDYAGGKSEDYFRSIDFAVLDHSGNQYNFKEFSRNFKKFHQEI